MADFTSRYAAPGALTIARGARLLGAATVVTVLIPLLANFLLGIAGGPSLGAWLQPHLGIVVAALGVLGLVSGGLDLVEYRLGPHPFAAVARDASRATGVVAFMHLSRLPGVSLGRWWGEAVLYIGLATLLFAALRTIARPVPGRSAA